MTQKRLFALAMSAVLALSCVSLSGFAAEAQTAAEETVETAEELRVTYPIRTTEDWLQLVKLCRLDSASRNLRVVLENDISLVGYTDLEIPTFGGIFDGQGHSIAGFRFAADGATCGLFRYVQQDAEIRNLKLVAARVTPTGSADRVGALVGYNAGTIENCSVSAIVIGNQRTAGLAGFNEVGGRIENCIVTGFVHGTLKTGGITGENAGVVRSCINRAMVNTSVKDGEVNLENIEVDLLNGIKTISDPTDTGGIVGFNTGVIRSCVNELDVGYPHSGYNVGGIVGRTNGLVTDCRNEGKVLARKEAGGIVGQLEPNSVLIYNEDTIQKLKNEIGTLQNRLNTASKNIQNFNGELVSNMSVMRENMSEAADVLRYLAGLLQNGIDVDWSEDGMPIVTTSFDDIIAALNRLTYNLQNIGTASIALGKTVENGGSTLSGDLKSLTTEVDKMLTISRGANADEVLTLEDVSSDDVDEDNAGKVGSCRNVGNIRADINAGGIVGSIAFENSLDPEDDLTVEGSESLRMVYRTRALVYLCINEGNVQADKHVSGGICGQLTMGTLMKCENYARVESKESTYAGGIAGTSMGNIETCYAKCDVVGSGYVGGIAGEAYHITDCVSMVTLDSKGEYVGMIAGHVNKDDADEKDVKFQNNVFVYSEKYGGIDGVSYEEYAAPKTYESLLMTDGLPSRFSKMYVTFRDENDYLTATRVVDYGQPLTDIPAVPEKEGYSAMWKEFDASCITADMTITPEYKKLRSVSRAVSTTDNMPGVLVEGTFTEHQKITLEPAVADNGFLLTIPEAGSSRHTIRAEVTEGSKAAVSVVIDGQWKRVDSKMDGHYVVFEAEGNQVAFFLEPVKESSTSTVAIVGAVAGILVLLVIGFILARIRKKKKAAPKPEAAERSDKPQKPEKAKEPVTTGSKEKT